VEAQGFRAELDQQAPLGRLGLLDLQGRRA
jgi:hypothetical protein